MYSNVQNLLLPHLHVPLIFMKQHHSFCPQSTHHLLILWLLIRRLRPWGLSFKKAEEFPPLYLPQATILKFTNMASRKASGKEKRLNSEMSPNWLQSLWLQAKNPYWDKNWSKGERPLMHPLRSQWSYLYTNKSVTSGEPSSEKLGSTRRTHKDLLSSIFPISRKILSAAGKSNQNHHSEPSISFPLNKFFNNSILYQ